MKIYKQANDVLMIHKQKVASQVSSNREKEQLSNPFFGIPFLQDIKELRNSMKGAIGENIISLILRVLPNSWIMLNNVIIPTHQGESTEIDLLIIGNTGIYLIEVKTWKGSYSAYKDNWKTRNGKQWVPLDKSPTQQSLYHKKIFSQWIDSKIPNLPKQAIIAPVIFLSADWIGAKECSVPVFNKIENLLKLMTEGSQILSEELIENIAQCIVNINIDDFKPQENKQIKEQPILKPNPRVVKPNLIFEENKKKYEK